jgi:hypothetical protein
LDSDELYNRLKERPRDARWLLRKVGPDYEKHIRALRESGRPVSVSMESVGGVQRAVYRADDQFDLFSTSMCPPAPDRRPARRTRRRLKTI